MDLNMSSLALALHNKMELLKGENITLQETARIMPNEYVLPQYLWPKAVNMICYILIEFMFTRK